jgi:hypothetical protein
MRFDAFAHSVLPGYWKHVFKKPIFSIWSGEKRVLMHLRILPDH